MAIFAAVASLYPSSDRADVIAPGFALHQFDISAEAPVPGESVAALLREGTGTNMTITAVQEALRRFQQSLREHGFTNASVTLPRQVLTEGVARLEVVLGVSTNAVVPPSQESAVAPPPKPRTFEVSRYDVSGNTLLSPEKIEEIFKPATGSAVSLAQVQQALGALQLAYRERGYVTVGVGLPQQQLTNAIVKVQVTEGVLTDIQVTGNRYFSSNNVRRALPSLRTQTLLNDRIFQRELDLANQNRDRQIYPVVSPGPDPGTSALQLKIKDRLPLHGRLELNNYATPGTPEWRVNTSGQYNNLWQREHQAGLSYGFSPEAFKSKGLVSDYVLNRPLISYYGGYYRMPFGDQDSVADQIASSPGFGYNEATHQFRLPPAGGRPDLTFFASGSSSDTGIKAGPETIVSQTPLLRIVSQDTGQNLSVNESVGGRVSLPVALSDTQRLTFSAGPDWKRFALDSFNTNNFIITTVVTNAQGAQTIESRIASPQPARHHEVSYLPLTLEAGFSETDLSGSFSATAGLSGNALGTANDFASLASSPRAKALWGKATAGLTREQKLLGSWTLLLRGNGQVATGPLISNEQFALGGMNSVRGYAEGEEYGDSGWSGSAEFRTPSWPVHLPWGEDLAPAWLRGVTFIEGGQRFLQDQSAATVSSRSLCGTGFGASASLDNHFDVRLGIGWPLLNSGTSRAGQPHAYFAVGGQF